MKNKNASDDLGTVHEAQSELIDLLKTQVMDLTAMSGIELGDDVVVEIMRLEGLIESLMPNVAVNSRPLDNHNTSVSVEAHQKFNN